MRDPKQKMKKRLSPKESVLEFERFIVSEYLRYGSVDEILRANRFENLGVSYPGIYHILKRWEWFALWEGQAFP